MDLPESQDRLVRRRRVFFVPGYDPFPPRRYRELYRRESALQASITGYRIAMAASIPGAARFGWTVDARIDGRDIETRFEVLVWSDIVQASMAGGILATYGQLMRTSWLYVRSGALGRLMRLRQGPVIAALYPVVILLAQLGLALVLARFAGALAAPWGGPSLAWGAAVLVGIAVLVGFRKADARIYAYYLMQDYAFSAQDAGANPAALEARLDSFAETVSESLSEDWDEVLVIGHSTGAQIAVSLLARMLRAGALQGDGPAVSLLTLGQVIPMVSFLPDAHELRADLHLLAGQGAVAWVDVSAPADGASFALCDPVAVTGVASERKRWPLVISAAYSHSLSPERLHAMRWRFLRLHFQYLCAFDNPQGFDYFRTTAGPQTLGALFQGRAPSASRITTPLSPHTALTP